MVRREGFWLSRLFLMDETRWGVVKKIYYIPVKKENTEPLRVAAYCRVSTKKETQLASLAHQIVAYTEQISDHPGWVFSGVFWDCGRCGLRKKGRNGLKHMLESATEGKFDYIITKSAKRVSRNTVELLQIMRYLKERGIQMYFEIENVNSFNPDAEAAITLSGAMGQEESRNLSENIQWGIQRKFEEGLFSSYKHFMGYRCVEGELVIVPEQAEIVRLIFELYLKGYTFSQIKKHLEESGVKTVTGKTVWSANVIQQMLKNGKYKGDMMLQKTFTEDYLNGIRKKNIGQRTRYYVKGSHPAIISPEIFDKVQEEMLNRARLIRTANGNQISSGNRYSSKYLLSKLLVCGYCGGGFRRRTERGKIVWRCGTRMEKGKAECENSPTLNNQDVREMLGKVVCNGKYDENVVKDRVKRIDVYEKRLIICYAEKEGYQICELE